MNFVTEIYDFNKQAGLLEKGYDDFLESSFQIEEALEGFESPASDLTLSFDGPKNTSRAIVSWMQRDSEVDFEITDVDRLDKAIDAIVFAVGSIAKLGLNVEQIQRAISVVTKANLQKLSNIKVDSNGKLLKDSNFVGPEHELQQILNERVIK